MGTRSCWTSTGPKAVADWMLEQKRLLITDTTMRDGHQSLLATRMRSLDMIKVAPAYAAQPAELFSAWNAGAARPSTWPTASCRNALAAPARPARGACPTC
jgi:pyruvate carboxylase